MHSFFIPYLFHLAGKQVIHNYLQTLIFMEHPKFHHVRPHMVVRVFNRMEE